MGKLYFKENYEAALGVLKRKSFYIFGNTLYAHMFYLFCKEHGAEKNIRGFILSDMSKLRDNRKVHILHGVPIKDIDWLAQEDRACCLFLAARERTVNGQLFLMLEDRLDAEMYYVSDFVHSIMFHHYMSHAYENIITRYSISENPYEGISLNITGGRENNLYSYAPRVSQGVLPDVRIFGKSEELDRIYRRQLGDYSYIDDNCISRKKEDGCRCKIYLTRSHFDKKLKEDFYTPFTEEIQVGAALTDADISELKDNIGENLSDRNRDYCEMSAVYWAWKNNRDNDYIGLCHYRRRFVIDEDMINDIMAEDYGAVYTVPQLIDGGLREEFVERNYYLTPEMWELTENAIQKLSPEYLPTWKELETSYFLLSYNMFIMRRDVFEGYCSWAFAILEEIDRFYLNQGIQCNNRYLGYIAELLNTVYAMKHKETLKKGYVCMKMLESEN
ncbi:MAG: DUF4422 domain-containing protein [Dorea sp.]|jgi:hypothetical protein|nr:DUF4422 domain-containing protein [Dorea sp.]